MAYTVLSNFHLLAPTRHLVSVGPGEAGVQWGPATQTLTSHHRIINVEAQIWVLCRNVPNLNLNLNIPHVANAYKSECTQGSVSPSPCPDRSLAQEPRG